jgi:hypothetical protein
MKVISAKHEVNLQEHMRRSDLLEKRTDLLFIELEPVKTHIANVDGAIKLIGGLSMILGLIFTVLKLFGKV